MATPQPVETVAAEQPVPQINPAPATAVPSKTLAFTEPQAVTEPPTVTEPQAINEPPNTPEPVTDLRTPHNDESVSDEISRKADEILARLHTNANITPAIEPEEQILSDIRTQQRQVTDSQLLGEPLEQSVPMPEPAVHQDDSEMLVVNTTPDPAETNQQPATFPMTDSPISSGRAARMDYEKLFDRLRNQPDENKQ